MKKLAIIITHPIQYYVPVFSLLAQQCKLKVFYTWGEDSIKAKYDPGFGKTIAWDLPLLEGYEYELLKNTSKDPGSHHGKGIINPHIIKKIEEFSPNAILVYGYIYQSHFKAMRHFKGKIPIWFRGDSTLLDEKFGFKSIIKKFYLKWVYSHLDKAFYVGTKNKAYFKKFGLKEEQLIFAPHAIDNERFASNRKLEAKALRERLCITEDSVLILFAGKLERKKNPKLLLEAFIDLITERIEENRKLRIVSPKIPETNYTTNVHLLFVGNGVLEKTLKKKVSLLNSNIYLKPRIINKVHFIDFQNQTQMPIIYQACDIFCLPSQGPGETWGLAVNEAMASAKAIIVSDKVGCAVDLVKTNINGYIFKSGDKRDLVEKMSLIILSSKKQSFGRQSSELIRNWNFKAIADTLIENLLILT